MTVRELFEFCEKHNALDIPLTMFKCSTLDEDSFNREVELDDIYIDPETDSSREVSIDCN